jgi:hypothetical protein
MSKQFAKLKIYEVGGGVAFQTETGTIPFITIPKGQATMKPWGPSGFVFEKVVTGEVIAFVDTFDDLLDDAGVAWGASQAAVYTAVGGFFFELGGGGVTQYSPANAAAQYQSLLQCHTFTVATIAAGVNFLRGYYITAENDVNFSELIASISAGVAGNSIFGIYSVKADGYPDELLYNTTVFNNLTTGGQINIQSGTLKAGTYLVAQSSSSAATFRAFAAQFYLNTANYFGQTDGAILHTGISVNYVYDGTLPAVFPVGGTKTTGILPYLLFKIV